MKISIANKITLEGAPAELAQILAEKFTLANPAYQDAVKFNRRILGIKQHLRFYNVQGSALFLPRGAGEWIHGQALQYGECEVVDETLALPEIDLQFSGSLRPYQLQAVQGILARRSGVVEAGTGSGKTVMGLALIATRKQPTLILVHTKELLYQWRNRIKTVLGIEAGLIGDCHFDIQSVTVGIVNTAKIHLNALTSRFGHLIVDECHRVPANLFSDVVTAFSSKYMLGLSATPFRRDGLDKLIDWYLGIHRVVVETATLHEVGAILRPEIVTRETGFRYFYDDDYQAMVSALIQDDHRNAQVVGDINQQAKAGGLSLVVSDRVEHLTVLAGMTRAEHRILTGNVSAKKRREIVDEISTGNVRVLFSTLSLIGEGFDCPSMDSLFITTPIKHSGRLKQVVGRVLRPAEGKLPMVFDYVDSHVGLLAHQARGRQQVYSLM